MIESKGSTRALVSVVVCAYNNWPDVEMTIESALHQSHQPIEVIVVDNSSADVTSREIPARFGTCIRYVRQPNRGDSGAYNTGFDIARGDFVQFVDGDDVLAPNKIQKALDMFRDNPQLDIVYADVRHFQTAPGVASWEDVATQPEDDMLRAFIVQRNGWTGIATLGTLFRRSALEKVGRWDEELYVADLDYWLRAASAGCRFGHCQGSVGGFVRRRSAQMTANRDAMERGVEAVWNKALGYIKDEPYRSLLAGRLADNEFRSAVARDQMSVSEALSKLALARETSPRKISALAYACGYAAIVLPGGSLLVRSARLRAIRRRLASWLRFRKSE